MAEIISSYFTNLLQLANVFISFFIMIIAYIFFVRTKPHHNRTPWVMLFVAVGIFFLFELSGILFQSVVPALRDFFKTLFIVFILYIFIYQNYLLEHSSSIVIEKKENTPLNILLDKTEDKKEAKEKTKTKRKTKK